MWNEMTKNRSMADSGSVQRLEIPAELKALYRTVWDIPQRAIIDMANRDPEVLHFPAVCSLCPLPPARTKGHLPAQRATRPSAPHGKHGKHGCAVGGSRQREHTGGKRNLYTYI
jgi:hypothetical protein